MLQHWCVLSTPLLTCHIDGAVILESKKKMLYAIMYYNITPTTLYGAGCWAMRKKEEHLLNKTEMRMLRWIQGISLKDHVRSEEIRKRLNVVPNGDSVCMDIYYKAKKAGRHDKNSV